MKKLLFLLLALFAMGWGMRAQTALPYYQDFENVAPYAVLPGGWISLRGNGATRIDRDMAHRGSGSLRIGKGEDGSIESAWVALPIMEVGAGELEMDFWLGAESAEWSGALEVGYYTSLLDTGSFVAVDTFFCQAIGTDYVERLVRFEGAPVGAVIGFRCRLGYYGWRLDDVYVQRSGGCPPVAELRLDALDATSATVAWRATGSASSWWFTLCEGADTVASSSVADSVYRLEGLMPDVDYWLFVASECDSGGLSCSRYLTFRTPCVGVPLPYSEDFDAVGEGAIPECWSIEEHELGSPVGVMNAGSDTRSTSPFLNLRGASTVLSPLTAVPLNEVEVGFDVLRGSDGSVDTILVGYLTNRIGEVTWTDSLVLEPGRRGDYVPFRTNFSGSGVSQPGYVAIRHFGSSVYTLRIDNFEMNRLSGCERPEDLRILSLYAHEAAFAWRGAVGSVDYDFAYSVEDDVAGDSVVVVNVQDSTVVVSGLQADRDYYVWLRAACPNGVSPWVRYGRLRTPCFPADSLPFSEGFEGCDSSLLPPCWTWESYGDWSSPSVVGTENYSPYAAHGGVKGVLFQNSHLALPLLEAPVSSLQLSFYVRSSAATSFAVGVMGDPRNLASFDSLYVGVAGEAWSRVVVPFGNYAGSGSFLAIRADGLMYMDDVFVDVLGECPGVSNLVVNAATAVSLSLSWTENGTAEAWEVVCISGFDTIRAVAYTNSFFEMEGLSPRTDYLILISPLCASAGSPDPLVGRAATLCAPVEVFPWTENFSWMAIDESPTCWSDGSAVNPNLPSWRVFDDGGNGCVRVLNNLSGEASLSSPPIVVPDSSYELVFDYAHRAASGLLGVWIEAGGSRNVATLGGSASVSALQAGTMVHRVVDLARYAGDTIMVRFSYGCDASGGAVFLDNVGVRHASLCPRVAGLCVDSVGTSSVRVHWSPQDGVVGYEVVYGLNGFAPDFGNALLVSDSVVWLSGLLPNTHYELFVRCVCGDYGEPCGVGFATRCEAVGLPFLESFDNLPHGVGVSPDCWSLLSPGGSNAFVDDFANLYFYFGTISGNAFRLYGGDVVAAPPLPLPLNRVDVSFRLAANWLVEGFQVGFLRSLDLPLDSMVLLQTYRFDAPFDFVEGHLFAIESPIADTGFIVFKCLGDNELYYGWIDDFEVRASGSCATPINLALRSLSHDGATISWTGVGDSYEVRYAPTDSPILNSQFSILNSTILNSLQPSTSYEVQVRSICGGDTSGWSLPLGFTTRCVPEGLPFVYSFENCPVGQGVLFDSCWVVGSVYGSRSPYVSEDRYAGLAPCQGSGYLFFSGVSGEYAVLPLIDASLDDIVLRFMARSCLSGSEAGVSVGVMDSPYDTASFVEVADLPIYGTDYAEFRSYFVDYQGSGRSIALRGQGAPFLIDSLVVDLKPSCPEPINLRTSSLGSLRAEVEWVETGSATSWMVQYRPFYVSEWTTLPTVTGVPHVLLSGLSPATSYEVRVRALCSSSSQSAWSRSLSFTTLCDEPPLPYDIDFELPLGTLPHCFEVLSYSGTPPAVCEGYYAFNNASRYLLLDHPCEVATPRLAAPLNQLLVEFDLFFASRFDTLFLGCSSDGRFLPIATLSLPADLPVGEPYHVRIDCASSQIYDSVSLRFRFLSDRYMAIDNLHIDRLPTCPPVESLSLLEATSSSVSLDWVDRGSPVAWQVKYVPSTQQFNNSSIQQFLTHPVTISGLDAQTSYDFQVRPICGVGDTGAWMRNALRVSTDCPLRFLPYVEDFLHVGGTAYNTEGVLPPCWESYSNATLAYAHPHVVEEGIFVYPYSNHGLILMAGSPGFGDTAVVRLPRFYQPLSSVSLSYYLHTEREFYGKLEVGYIVGGDLATDFVALRELQGEDFIYGDFDSVSFSEVPPQAQCIAFRWTAPASLQHFAACTLDEINVSSSITTCDNPRLLAADSSYESYTLTWEGLGDDYELGYRLQSASAYTASIIVHGHSYTISGLEPSQRYTLRFRQRCDAQHASEWIFLDFATDTLICSAPSALRQLPAEEPYTSVTLNWEGEADRYVVKLFNSRVGEIRDTVVGSSATLFGLAAGEAYYASVQALCGNRYEFASHWSDTLDCFTLDCLPVSDVRCYDVTDTTVTLAWTTHGTETSWTVAYGYPGFGQGEEIGSIVADRNPYELPLAGLDPFSDYEVYLYAQCAPGVSSIPAGPVTFRTGNIGIPSQITDYRLQINIYPNPSSGSFSISIPPQLSALSSQLNIDIADMNGRTILSSQLSTLNAQLSVQGTPKGVYFVRIYGEGINSIRKLIVR